MEFIEGRKAGLRHRKLSRQIGMVDAKQNFAAAVRDAISTNSLNFH